GGVVGVDAVRALRPPPSFRDASYRAARRRSPRVGRAESFVRVLFAVFWTGRALLHRVGAHDARAVARSKCAAPRGRRVRDDRHRDAAVSAAVSRAETTRLQPAIARGDAALLG